MSEYTPDIESKLLSLVAKGNHSAFAELFHCHRDKLYSFLLNLCGSQQQAEDIVQDIFLKIWTTREALTGIHHFQAYLFRMSHNHCINLLKRNAQEAAIVLSFKTEFSSSLTEDHIQMRETTTLVRNAIDHLPVQQRLVFTMSREEGLNQQEISEKLHISVPTVKSHMTQALRSLRMQCKSLSPVIKSLILTLSFLYRT